MNKEFIPYEQALELKELGFDEDCFQFYMHSNLLTSNIVHLNHIDEDLFAKAPLYQQAFRWFRDRYWLTPQFKYFNNNNCEFEIIQFIEISVTPKILSYGISKILTYQEAELACLKKLIEIVKNK